MSENLKQIALRIKSLREIDGISQEAAAALFKIPAVLYKKYESGNTDIPVSLLYEVSKQFKVELTALLTGEEPRLHTYSLVRAGKGPSVDRRKEYKYQDLAYNFIHKKAEAFLVNVEAKPEEKLSFNSHPGQEFTFVLEGRLKVLLDGHELLLKKGDSLFFDSKNKHAMTAVNCKTAKFLAIIL